MSDENSKVQSSSVMVRTRTGEVPNALSRSADEPPDALHEWSM